MDEYDRDRGSRTSDTYRRKQTRTDAEPYSETGARSSSSRSKSQPTPSLDDPDAYDVAPPNRSSSSTSRSTGQQERYSDRFRKNAPAGAVDEADDASYRSTRDPYDRLRRVSNRPPKRVDPEDEGDPYGYLDEDYDERLPPPSRSRSTRSRNQPRTTPSRAAMAGLALANPTADMRPLVLGGGAALGSLLLLSILILVRSGSADVWLPMHLNAEGTPTVYGTTSAIWRLPFFALMTTVMAVGLGWFLRLKEPFAAQYLVVGALLVHVIIWVGTITLLW